MKTVAAALVSTLLAAPALAQSIVIYSDAPVYAPRYAVPATEYVGEGYVLVPGYESRPEYGWAAVPGVDPYADPFLNPDEHVRFDLRRQREYYEDRVGW